MADYRSSATFSRADLVKDFVEETWPVFGPSAVTGFQEVLRSVLEELNRHLVKRLEDHGYTFVASSSAIIICAVCHSSTFVEILRCVYRLTQVLGTPNDSLSIAFTPDQYFVSDETEPSENGVILGELETLLGGAEKKLGIGRRHDASPVRFL